MSEHGRSKTWMDYSPWLMIMSGVLWVGAAILFERPLARALAAGAAAFVFLGGGMLLRANRRRG